MNRLIIIIYILSSPAILLAQETSEEKLQRILKENNFSESETQIRNANNERIREENQDKLRKETAEKRDKILFKSLKDAQKLVDEMPNATEIHHKALSLGKIIENKANQDITSSINKINPQKNKIKKIVFNKKKKEDKIIILSEGGATFDADDKIAIFEKTQNTNDHVRLVHPQFDMICDRLVVFLNKNSAESEIDEAIATGYVEIIKQSQDGSKIVAVSKRAKYIAKEKKMILSIWPQIQKGSNIQKATSGKTIMIVNESGRLDTRGPSKIILVQNKDKGIKVQNREKINEN